MKKGEGKFFIKAVYLILVIIAINLFIFQYISLKNRQYKIIEKMDIKIATENILNQLISSGECLAYEENITIEGSKINEVTHKIIDIEKIKDFETKFSLYEPNCTKTYGYGYYVVIEKYNFTRLDKEREDMPPLEGKDVVLILDATESMNQGGKFAVEKDAAKKFIDCADEENRIGIVVIKDCGNIGIFEINGRRLVSISEHKEDLKNYIDSITTVGGTDIKTSLEEAFKILRNSDKPKRYKMILLLTDGCESCGVCQRGLGNYIGGACYYENYCQSCPPNEDICDKVKSLKTSDDNIHVFTVGLFTSGCRKEEEYGGMQLKCISDETKGKYYLASSTGRLVSIFCQLGRGSSKVMDQKDLWEIGPKDHSLGESLKESYSLSLPVSIRFNGTYTQSGKITIYVFDGELENLAYIINQACIYGDVEAKVSVSYKTYLKNENNVNKLCMLVGSKEVCKALTCSKQIEFKPIEPGTYVLKANAGRNYLKVIV